LAQLLAELPTVTEELRVLGAYQRGSMEFGEGVGELNNGHPELAKDLITSGQNY
jgi:hypothetical protein